MKAQLFYLIWRMQEGGQAQLDMMRVAEKLNTDIEDIGFALQELEDEGLINVMDITDDGKVLIELPVHVPERPSDTWAAAKVLKQALERAKTKRELKNSIQLALELLPHVSIPRT